MTDFNSINRISQIYTQQTKVNRPVTKDKANKPVPQDNIAISQSGKEMQKIRQALQNVPTIREEKVAELQERIKNGTYYVSGEQIAEKMLKDALLDKLF